MRTTDIRSAAVPSRRRVAGNGRACGITATPGRARPRPSAPGLAGLVAAALLLTTAMRAAAQQPDTASAAAEPMPAAAVRDSTPTAAAAPPPTPCDSTATLLATGLVSPTATFARAMETAGLAPLRSRLIRRSSDAARQAVCVDPAVPWRPLASPRAADLYGVRVEALPATVDVGGNSEYPTDANNGALWAGAGLTLALNAGARARWGPLSAAFAPLVAWQQNADFPTPTVPFPGYDADIYRGHPMQIDWPERFGTGGFWTLDPGQSYVRLDAGGVAAGVSTENLWWGPAMEHPLLMSNTAPGFPHGFVGTSSPVHVWIGTLEAQAVWGRLSESRYFDADASNDHRLFGGLIATFRPRGLDGLWIGAARAYVSTIPVEGANAFDYLLAPYRHGGVSGPDGAAIRLGTLFARLVLPASGFEAYAEAALPGYHRDAGRDTASARDRNAAWVAGIAKVTPVGGRWLRIHVEAVQLENGLSLRTGQPTATYYVDDRVRQGYTHRGQLLGSATGPGSEAQTLAFDLYGRRGSIGLVAQRALYDDDAYFDQFVQAFGFHGHDVEVSLRLRQTLRLSDLQLFWSAGWAYRWNRHFMGLDSYNWRQPSRTDVNWSASLGAAWIPRW